MQPSQDNDLLKEKLKKFIMREIYDPLKDERLNRRIEQHLGLSPEQLASEGYHLVIGLPNEKIITLYKQAAHEVAQNLGFNFMDGIAKKPWPDDLVFFIDNQPEENLKRENNPAVATIQKLQGSGACVVLFADVATPRQQNRVMNFQATSRLDGVELPSMCAGVSLLGSPDKELDGIKLNREMMGASTMKDESSIAVMNSLPTHFLNRIAIIRESAQGKAQKAIDAKP